MLHAHGSIMRYSGLHRPVRCAETHLGDVRIVWHEHCIIWHRQHDLPCCNIPRCKHALTPASRLAQAAAIAPHHAGIV
jgi:hypothetical protein